MDALFRLFSGSARSESSETKVVVKVENCVVFDGSQIFVELSNGKGERFTLDDLEKTLFTEDLDTLVVNVYRHDYFMIGSKNLELMKKIYYYDAYSLINAKQIDFHTLVEFTSCRFQVHVKLFFSAKMKNLIKKQRFKNTNSQVNWFSCFQSCNKCSEVTLE